MSVLRSRTRKGVIPSNKDVKVEKTSSVDELKGKLRFNKVDDKLMHSVLENDKEKIEEGKTIKEAINQGISSFTPDLMFEQIVKDYMQAERIYGKSLLRYVSGYDPNYLGRNIKIPEFQRELKNRLEEGIKKLKKDEFVDEDGSINEKGVELASLIMYMEELDEITAKGEFGQKIHKKISVYGGKEDNRMYKKGDRYKDIAIKKSVKLAVRRGHDKLGVDDLKVFERESKGMTYVVYGMDASGSMRGKKIETSKKAGIALAYKATENRDSVGLIVFGTKIKEKIEPTEDFGLLLRGMSGVKASMETNFIKMINEAIKMFPSDNVTKHLIILSDALPTIGKEPEEDTLKAVSVARSNGITISLVGIGLDKKGKKFGEKIVELGEGRLYVVKDLEQLDKIILEDYYSVA